MLVNFFYRRWVLLSLLLALGITMVSCVKIEFPFGKLNSNSSSNTREYAGVEYTIIKPKDYADKLKEGEIGVGEKYVMDGIILGTSETTLMLQQAGLTNIFTLNEPLELEMGAKIRIYIEVRMVNTILLKASEAKIIKLEKS